jgi:hypothetical protein
MLVELKDQPLLVGKSQKTVRRELTLRFNLKMNITPMMAACLFIHLIEELTIKENQKRRKRRRDLRLLLDFQMMSLSNGRPKVAFMLMLKAAKRNMKELVGEEEELVVAAMQVLLHQKLEEEDMLALQEAQKEKEQGHLLELELMNILKNNKIQHQRKRRIRRVEQVE